VLTDQENPDTFSVPTGEYWLEELATLGWDLTGAVCTVAGDEIQAFDPRADGFNVSTGANIVCTFTNTQYVTPSLTIAKWNNVTGDKEIGDEVEFTIRVTAHTNDVKDVVVTDLFSEGFEYVGGSWSMGSTESRSLAGLGLTKVYASPGVWTLGDMVKDEVVTLTYRARITDELEPGTYKDLAWVDGKDAFGDERDVLGTAEATGYIAQNFVGTEVPVVVDEPTPEAKAKIKTTIEKEEVLGAATELPNTGSNNLVLLTILTFLGIGLGLVLNGLGISFKKKTLAVVLTAAFGVALFTGTAFAANSPYLNVRLEKPESPVTNSFDLTFVALDINDRALTAECYSSDSASPFETMAVSSGGNTNICQVDSSTLSGDGTYTFWVKIYVTGDTEVYAESNKESVIYDGGTPGKPKYIEKDKKNDCKYEVTFKTADDNGETTYVEIYRDSDKEYTVSDSKRIRTITVGSNERKSFDNELYGSDCGHTPYYSIRAFNSAGTPSGVRSEEVTKTEKVTVEGETTVTTGAIIATGGQVGQAQAGAEGAQVVLPGTEGAAGEETPAVLGEQGENGKGTAEESTTTPTILSSGVMKPVLIGLGILGVILVIYASRKKKS
jgi:uncharacterized repeat protein (TIGR01451 family)